MKLLLALVFLLLTGCNITPRDTEPEPLIEYTLPAELGDCKIYSVKAPHFSDLIITRCPNATTATKYRVGKSGNKTTIVVDGITYEKSETKGN